VKEKWKYGLPILAVLLFSIPALSQSCALCYTQAASSGVRFITALRDGIFVLIVPPMFMSVGITWLAYRKRNQFRQDIDTGGQFGEDRESFEE
jgi:hypothetical protein